MKFDLIISNIMIGILVICSAFALMFVFYIQRKLTPEQYFSFQNSFNRKRFNYQENFE